MSRVTNAPRHTAAKRSRKRQGLIAAVAVLAVSAGAFAWPGSPIKDTAISLAKYRECFNPGGEGPLTAGLGDSITAGHSLGWMGASDSYYDIMACQGEFAYAGNAGVWQETTGQILARTDDVIATRPDQVLILAGTNDVRQGATSDSLSNLSSMAEKFKAAGIKPVFGALPPSEDKPAETQAFNDRLVPWAASEGVQLIDYWTPLADTDGTYKPGLHSDKIHPSPEGAQIMATTAWKALH